MRTIAAITGARSDYGILFPVLEGIQRDPELCLRLIVAGSHLSQQFGMTVDVIEQDGFQIYDRVDMQITSDSPEGIARSMGLGTIGFAQSYARSQPDLLLVVGDRYETHAAVVAALPFNIPVAHIHGGESTLGAIDDVIRHSITKMSHLHFAATQTYAKRLLAMGEEHWRVQVTGAPSLDNLRTMQLLSRDELCDQLNLESERPFVLVTYHPVTREYEKTSEQVQELLAALAESKFDVLFTYPNADTGNRKIVDAITSFTQGNDRANLAVNLGSRTYFSAMNHAVAMVGNSSSGMIEAASVQLPVVDIGSRQKGRIHGDNVIHVSADRANILAGIKEATTTEFRSMVAGLVNPYGDGHAAGKIVDALKTVVVDDQLLMKRFPEVVS